MSKPQDPRIYVRILAHVRDLIDRGTIGPGESTPTIETLCHSFGCTRQTAAKAFQLLEQDGYLTRYPGLGYYVALD